MVTDSSNKTDKSGVIDNKPNSRRSSAGLAVAKARTSKKTPVSAPKQDGKLALVIGGGAPNYTLMTGALLAADEAGIKFDVISAAGGGGLVALLYLAPKKLDRQAALRNSVNLGVSDEIYRRMPMNYKAFQKGSKIAALFRKALTRLPGYQKIMDQSAMSDRQKLVSDLIQMVWALMTPSTVTWFSKGLCAHAPWVTDLVDFAKLKDIKEDLYFNAYCLDSHELAIFDKKEIDERHFGATLSYPFFYPPTKIDGKLYIEGASQDAYNFEALLECNEEIDTLVVLDSFSNAKYMVPATNLWTAFAQEVITPLISLSRMEMRLSEYMIKELNEQRASARPPKHKIDLVKICFDIPKKWAPTALDWSRSNLQRNFDLGYKTMKQFIKENPGRLGNPAPANKAQTNTTQANTTQTNTIQANTTKQGKTGRIPGRTK